MTRRSAHPHILAIGLLALTALALRAASLDAQSLWRDEVDALLFATAPRSAMLSNFTRPGWNGPLYFLLLRGWIALTGSGEYSLRFFSLFFGVLGVPLTYALARRLFDRRTGLLAALLVTASPYLTWYGQEAKMYTLVPALALLALYALRRAFEGHGWHWWAAQIVATSLAFYSHILAALLIPVQVLVYLVWGPRTRRQWIGGLVSLALLTLPYLPLAFWQSDLLLQARETGFHPYALDDMAAILLNGWSLGIHSLGHPWGTALMGALAAWGLLHPLAGAPPPAKKTGEIVALLCWLAVPVLAVWVVSLWQPLFTDRYLIWAAPAFYILAALGLASLWRSAGWRLWAVVFLVSATLALDGINLWHQATTPIKSDFRAAAAYVANYRGSDGPVTAAPEATMRDEDLPPRCYLPLVVTAPPSFDELIVFQIPHARHTFDYYFARYFDATPYPWADGIYTNHRTPDGSYLMGEREAARRMQEMTRGHEYVWLVATEVAMWDERGLVQAWLETNACRIDEAHFAHVDVYRYAR